jgi:hypothetical protein
MVFEGDNDTWFINLFELIEVNTNVQNVQYIYLQIDW